MSEYFVINRRTPRRDAPSKATGSAVYIDDMSMPGMLYGALLQSTLAHAKILNIDVSRAKKLPGVKAVVTAKEAGLVRYGVSPARYDETLFCHDKVRYVGDEIAAVAAIDLKTALEAVSLIHVDYEILPAVFTAEEAMAEDAPQLHEDYPRNVCTEIHQEFGDVEAALQTCDLVRSDTFITKAQNGGFLEPQGCLANYDLNGFLTLYSSTQIPHYLMRTIAMVLRLPVGRVRVVKPFVGGGFGPKAGTNSMELAACLLSMKVGKPVKMNYTREQVFFFARGRHQYKHVLTTGVKRDGTIVAVKNEAYLDGGAYASFGIATAYYAGSLLGGPYKLSNMKYDGYRVYTNKPACGAQRGHGGVAARAVFEQQLDIIAEELGVDPIDLRLKNAMAKGDMSCNQFDMSSLGLQECIEGVREASGWNSKKGKLSKGKGIGVACAFYVSGAGFPIYRSETPHSTATIKISEDGGTVSLYTCSADIGQGSDETMAMIAAEALGVPSDAVKVFSGDTEFGVDLGAYSSRQTLMTGHAVKEASESVKKQVLDVLSEELKVPIEEIEIKNGLIMFKNPNVDFREIRTKYIKEHRGWTDLPEGDQLTFKEAARLAFLVKGIIVGTGKYKPPKLGGEFKGAAVGTAPAYSSSAQVAEVTVDMETGQVTVEKITDAHDCGFAINLTSVEGQMEGSVSMGLGEALFEEVKFDKKGRIVNANFGEYKVPTALDMPDIVSVVVESNEPNGPFGAKEVGEGALLPTIPAILNAIYDAIGIRFNELPLTPERVYLAIKRKREGGT